MGVSQLRKVISAVAIHFRRVSNEVTSVSETDLRMLRLAFVLSCGNWYPGNRIASDR